MKPWPYYHSNHYDVRSNHQVTLSLYDLLIKWDQHVSDLRAKNTNKGKEGDIENLLGEY
jgi:hypothetical protein